MKKTATGDGLRAARKAPGGYRLQPLARIHALRGIRTVRVQQATSRMRAACRGAIAAFVVFAAGCTSSLLDTELPPSVIYVIAPVPVPSSPPTTTIPVDLSIGRPDVAPGLDTNRIAVLKGRQLDYYRAARWGGSTTEVVQTFLVDSLEDQRLFRSVTAEQARVAGDYALDIELRDFQAEYTNDAAAPTVRVKLVGRLIRIVDRELVASLPAEAQSPASTDRMHAVAAAFEQSAQKAAIELAQKTAAAIAGDERQK